MARSEGGVSKGREGREERGGQIASLMKRNDGNANNTATDDGLREIMGEGMPHLGEICSMASCQGLYASDSDRTSYHVRAAKDAVARLDGARNSEWGRAC